MSEAQIQKYKKDLKNPNLGESDKARISEMLPENQKQIEEKLKNLQTEFPTRLSDGEKTATDGKTYGGSPEDGAASVWTSGIPDPVQRLNLER